MLSVNLLTPNILTYNSLKTFSKENGSINADEKKLSDSLLCMSSYSKARINFTGRINTGSKYKPLDTKEDYNNLLDEVMRCKNYKEVSPVIQENLDLYPDIPRELYGLIPYCGLIDEHDDINRFLSGRELKIISQTGAEKFTKLLDFSLRELDKKYGKYNGYVFRGGFFDPSVKQYYSASMVPEGAYSHSYNGDLSIIKTKTGHKINDFQEEYDKYEVFDYEKEILLPKDAKYVEIKEPNGEIDVLRKYFAKVYEKKYSKKIDFKQIKAYEEV